MAGTEEVDPYLSFFPGIRVRFRSRHASLLESLARVFERSTERPDEAWTSVDVLCELADTRLIDSVLPDDLRADALRYADPKAVTDVRELTLSGGRTGAVFASATTLLIGRLDGATIECFALRKPGHANDLPALSAVLWPLLRKVWLQTGRLMMHAASVLIDGRVVLLIADSGGGKSTTSLMLTRSGAQFLSDDISLLSVTDGFRVEGVREHVKVTPWVADRLPELAPYRSHLAAGSPKVAIPIEELFGPGCVASSGPLAAVMQLKIGAPAHSSVRLGGQAAYPLLLGAQHIYRGQQVDRRAADVLHDLLAVVPCFSLNVGPDPEQLLPVLRELVSKEAPASGVGS